MWCDVVWCGLDKFGRRFPKRTFDVGIAEQHAITFAAPWYLSEAASAGG